MEFQATAHEIARMDAALDFLDNRERLLQRALLELQQERRALRIVRGLATSTLAPIHRLPNEILGEIFWYGTQGSAEDEDCDTFAGLVLQVSKRWYNVAISTPSMWKRISLSSRNPSALKSRLERSKTLPIDIFAEFGPYDSPSFIAESMHILCCHVERWGSLTLRFVGITPFRDLLDVSRRCRGFAPQLERLSIMMDPYASQIAHTPVSLSLTMPNLRYVELSGVELDWRSVQTATNVVIPIVRPPLQWRQLANIRTLRLTTNVPLDIPHSTYPRLPVLEDLTVMKPLLGSVLQISMPSLRALWVEKGTSSHVHPEWEHHLRPYDVLPRLTSFVFGTARPCPPAFILHVLRCMPELASIRFEGSVPDNELFYTWATTSLSKDPCDWVCPKLHDLDIRGAQRDPSGAVEMFVKSRSGPRGGLPAPLSGWTLELDAPEPQYDDEYEPSDGWSESEGESDELNLQPYDDGFAIL